MEMSLKPKHNVRHDEKKNDNIIVLRWQNNSGLDALIRKTSRVYGSQIKLRRTRRRFDDENVKIYIAK